MWGELVGASCHKYGASWLGRVGFGANRQIFLDTCDYVLKHFKTPYFLSAIQCNSRGTN